MKKKQNKITYVCADNWQGLYLNGKLVVENHRLDIFDLDKILKLGIDYVEADDEWLGQVGNLPENLEDVEGIREIY